MEFTLLFVQKKLPVEAQKSIKKVLPISYQLPVEAQKMRDRRFMVHKTVYEPHIYRKVNLTMNG
jgi:hypothetical protein